jgi:hypothetical protein
VRFVQIVCDSYRADGLPVNRPVDRDVIRITKGL